MDTDWADDDTMSAEETLARFKALNPEPARGPHVPGGHVVHSYATSAVGVVVVRMHGFSSLGSIIEVSPQLAGV